MGVGRGLEPRCLEEEAAVTVQAGFHSHQPYYLFFGRGNEFPKELLLFLKTEL